MAERIRARRDTAANWTSENPILGLGELGYETDTGLAKFGDGTSTWTLLGYAIGYATGSFTATLTGCTTSPTGTVTYEKVGKLVTLTVPAISGTSNTTAATLTGLPAALQPAANAKVCLGRVVDAGATAVGTVSFAAGSGTITLGNGVGAGSFTNSGVKGVAAMTITYSVD